MNPELRTNLVEPAQQKSASGMGKARQVDYSDMEKQGFDFLDVLNTLWPNLSPELPTQVPSSRAHLC